MLWTTPGLRHSHGLRQAAALSCPQERTVAYPKGAGTPDKTLDVPPMKRIKATDGEPTSAFTGLSPRGTASKRFAAGRTTVQGTVGEFQDAGPSTSLAPGGQPRRSSTWSASSLTSSAVPPDVPTGAMVQSSSSGDDITRAAPAEAAASHLDVLAAAVGMAQPTDDSRKIGGWFGAAPTLVERFAPPVDPAAGSTQSASEPAAAAATTATAANVAEPAADAAEPAADGSVGKLHRPCSTCRASKVLCNREQPCSRCRRLGVGHLCMPPPTVQRGRPSTHSRLLQLRFLQPKPAPSAPQPDDHGPTSAPGAAKEGRSEVGTTQAGVPELPASSSPQVAKASQAAQPQQSQPQPAGPPESQPPLLPARPGMPPTGGAPWPPVDMLSQGIASRLFQPTAGQADEEPPSHVPAAQPGASTSDVPSVNNEAAIWQWREAHARSSSSVDSDAVAQAPPSDGAHPQSGDAHIVYEKLTEAQRQVEVLRNQLLMLGVQPFV